MGGLVGTMMQGMAFGAGSGVAHRAVDGVMGPRQMEVTHTNVPAGAGAEGAPVDASSMGGGACVNFKKAFMDCLNEHEGDISRCQYYHDALMDCKRGL